MRTYGKQLTRFILLLVISLLYHGCGSVKIEDMRMMDQVESQLSLIENLPTLTIRPDDILGIDVTSRNPDNVAAFQPIREVFRNDTEGSAAIGNLTGYRVDEEGLIYLPFLGGVTAGGKTSAEIRLELTEALKAYIPDVSVQVRFINFRVTIIGEVNRPNTYAIRNERLTILEAIGMAGDFTSYANRMNILLVRQRTDSREIARINTKDKSLFTSDYFYLQPNDVLYVEPLKAKQYATRGDFLDRYGSFVFSGVTVVTFLVSLLVNN